MDIASILYVEDEADIRNVVKMFLTSKGFEVHAFTDGEQALEHASDLKVDLVVLDVMLPRLDGPDTLLRLRELDAFQEVPCVFLTAKVDAHSVAKLKELDQVALISKPFELNGLVSELMAAHARCHSGGTN